MDASFSLTSPLLQLSSRTMALVASAPLALTSLGEEYDSRTEAKINIFFRFFDGKVRGNHSTCATKTANVSDRFVGSHANSSLTNLVVSTRVPHEYVRPSAYGSIRNLMLSR
jgi:hypothetical protein